MNQSLFVAESRSKNTGSPLAQLVETLQTETSRRGAYIQPEAAGRIMALESLGSGSALRGELHTAIEDLDQLIRQTTKDITGFGTLSLAQEEAANVAAISASGVKHHLVRDVSAAALARFSNESTTVIGHNHIVGATNERAMALEAYDERENKNALTYSVAYNLHAAKQDPFGEAFYPTVVITPNNVGFMMSIRLLYVYDEVRRDISGSINDFGRKNVIKAVIDASILRNDQTEIVPVYRKTSPAAATDSDKFFAAEVGTFPVTIDGQTVPTGALKIGAKLSILGIAQTAALLLTGVADQTEAVDSSVRLKEVYIKLKGAATDGSQDEVVRVGVINMPLIDFNAAPQGNSRTLQLNFTTESLKFTSTTKKVDGSASTLLAALSTNVVRLGTSLTGNLTQDTGTTQVNATPVEVTRVNDVNGVKLPVDAGAGKTAADVFAGATVVGYNLKAYRTNSNRRQRGQLIDTQYMNYLYTVPLLPPITALRPVGETETNDAALLSTLITTTHVRTSNAAVTALLDFTNALRDFVNSKDSVTEAPEILGVSRFLVSAAFLEEELDAELNLDSLTSTGRTEDLQNLIQNKIRDMAYRLYVASGYKAAADALYDGSAPKPMLIVGVDQILERYLTINGDTRLVGENMDYKLVSTQDSRMHGKIFFSFGMESTYNSGVPNPLHFGAMPWKPELALNMPMVRNGAQSFELTVQPSFRHVNNLPILGVITVKNIEKVIASKVDIYTKEQA